MAATFNGTRHRTDAELTTELGRLMQTHQITTEALAEILDLDLEETKDIVTGEDPLTSADVLALTSHIGIPPEDLLFEEADPNAVFRSSAPPQSQVDALTLAQERVVAFRFLNAVAG